MKKVEVKKLWNGRISLRDYVVDAALEKPESIMVRYKDDIMILSPMQLEKKFSITECTSKYDGKKYKLYDYDWKPADKNQRRLV
jgi:hypothetical protein